MRISTKHLSSLSVLGDARTGVVFSFTDRANSRGYLDGVYDDEQPFYIVAALPKGIKKRTDDTFIVALDGKVCIFAGNNRAIEIHSDKRGFSFEYGEPAKKRTKLDDVPFGQVFQYSGYHIRFQHPPGFDGVPAGKISVLHIESGTIDFLDGDLGVHICPSAEIVQTVSI